MNNNLRDEISYIILGFRDDIINFIDNSSKNLTSVQQANALIKFIEKGIREKMDKYLEKDWQKRYIDGVLESYLWIRMRVISMKKTTTTAAATETTRISTMLKDEIAQVIRGGDLHSKKVELITAHKLGQYQFASNTSAEESAKEIIEIIERRIYKEIISLTEIIQIEQLNHPTRYMDFIKVEESRVTIKGLISANELLKQ